MFKKLHNLCMVHLHPQLLFADIVVVVTNTTFCATEHDTDVK